MKCHSNVHSNKNNNCRGRCDRLSVSAAGRSELTRLHSYIKSCNGYLDGEKSSNLRSEVDFERLDEPRDEGEEHDLAEVLADATPPADL